MKFDLTLDKMNKDNTVGYPRYYYDFTSGHKLVISELGFDINKFYICEFRAPNGKSGELIKNTAQECFDEFKELFEDNEIREELMQDFVF